MSSRQFLPRLGKSTSYKNGTMVVKEPLKLQIFFGDCLCSGSSPVTGRGRVSAPVRLHPVALDPHSFPLIVVLCAKSLVECRSQWYAWPLRAFSN